MARKEVTTVLYTDDLTGEEIPEGEHVTLEFAYGSTAYVIDLNKKNAARFEELVTPFTQAARARRVTGGNKPAQVRRSTMNSNLAAIRTWARENGFKVSDRGRVPENIIKAYADANEGAKA